ncbi:hypothetical protein AYL99_08747 [Fonsecaea erecta]|uniref:Uncharacterized protein n=1 Tax=Fonsecaea erecta TaxID=1367422 RepID=A0A178ZC28_9EURO|nr:hypothetical protein AYL99_08747 [Fonsecaea erecta]OAP56635.1 hypothetical protein AYL99_08747 [Fonsecaea erecta]
MADTLDPVAQIYQGIWTDWSSGKIWGLTLTLSPTYATILTSSLAVFVTICGVQLWSILRYLVYRFATFTEPAMLTPHIQRQQAVLKSAGSDILATAERMLRLAWRHRRTSTGKPSLRSYSIGAFAMIYAISLWIGGVFSNLAISTGSSNGPWPVLVRSNHCGIWNLTYYDIVNSADCSTEDNFKMALQYMAKRGQDVQISLEYAQECYLAASLTNDKPPTCEIFKTSALNWTVSNTQCPFQGQACLEGSNAIVLETDQIDSHEDLGINAEPADRLKYWRRTACAVLNDTGRVTGWNGTLASTSSLQPSIATAYAYYGPSLYKSTEWTYSYSNFASFFDNFTSQVILPYQLDVEMAYALANPQWSVSDFQPVKELVQKDADINLLFLSYRGMYIAQVDDPWFSAHNEVRFDSLYPYLQTRFSRDQAISTLGCTEQHKFCTNDNICTDFLGFDQVQNVAPFNGLLTPHQNATFDRMLRAITLSSLRNLVIGLALTTNPLLASNGTYIGGSGAVLSTALPENQWVLELEYYHSIAMAHLQRTSFLWATGSIAPEPQFVDVEYILPPTDEQDAWFCKNMILRSTIYQSFSLVAIILFVTFGASIIIAAAIVNKLLVKPDPDEDLLDDGASVRSSSLRGSHVSHSRRSELLKAFELTNVVESVQNSDRVFAPSLPSNDRTVSTLSSQEKPEDGQTQPIAPPRPPRYSWMAISLDNLVSLAMEGPRQIRNSIWGTPSIGRPPAAYLSTSLSERPMGNTMGSWI